MKKKLVPFVVLIGLNLFANSISALPSSNWPAAFATARPTPLKTQIGIASYYGGRFNGRLTSNGERYDQNKLTAAHRTYPYDTIVRVTNQRNDKSVILRINDRGPYVNGRIIDVSVRAAKELDLIEVGIVKVKVEVLKWGQ